MNDSNPHDVTQDLQSNSQSSDDAAPAEQQERIGRYRIEKVLGQGGFGLVYLAHDEQLHRPVAMKVPHAKLIAQPEDAETIYFVAPEAPGTYEFVCTFPGHHMTMRGKLQVFAKDAF